MATEAGALLDLSIAINEPDPILRAVRLGGAWAEAGVLTMDGAVVADGIAALYMMIASWQASDPRAGVRLLSSARSGHRVWGTGRSEAAT